MKGGIYVFDHDETNMATTGKVGDLQATEAVFTEEKNGLSQVTIKLPYDELQKWKAVKVGCYIKCMVPVRVPPVISNDEFANKVKSYRLKVSE